MTNIESFLHKWKNLDLKACQKKIILLKIDRRYDDSTNWSDANSCFFVIDAILCLINIQKGNGHQNWNIWFIKNYLMLSDEGNTN